MKKTLLACTLSLVSLTAFSSLAAPVSSATPATSTPPLVNGLFGCESKKLVVSIPTVDEVKAVEICHVNGLTFNLKYGPVGKPVIDFNFMGGKSGGYLGEDSDKVTKNLFASKGDYRYNLTIGKNISFLVTEFKKDGKYERVEIARLINKLNKTEWEYLEKFMNNTKIKL